jgi:predicted Fe-Mo cluster-binding NifX family protein
MRIAITSNSNQGIDAGIYDHFGHSPYFTIVDFHNNLVKKTMIVGNPFVGTHQPGEVSDFLAKMDVKLVVAGGMGIKVKEMFKLHNIDVICGASGLVSDVIDQYLKGTLKDNADYESADKQEFHH